MLITADVSSIAHLLMHRPGAVIACPTETFYGLAASIGDRAALARVQRLKGRDAAKGLIVLVADMETAQRLAHITPAQAAFLGRFWPGALSVLLPSRAHIPAELAPGGRIALRISPHPLAGALVAAVGPVTSTSANPTGYPPAVSPSEVLAFDLAIDAILDGGPTPGGAPSTLVDLTCDPPLCLREGAIALASLRTDLPDMAAQKRNPSDMR